MRSFTFVVVVLVYVPVGCLVAVTLVPVPLHSTFVTVSCPPIICVIWLLQHYFVILYVWFVPQFTFTPHLYSLRLVPTFPRFAHSLRLFPFCVYVCILRVPFPFCYVYVPFAFVILPHTFCVGCILFFVDPPPRPAFPVHAHRFGSTFTFGLPLPHHVRILHTFTFAFTFCRTRSARFLLLHLYPPPRSRLVQFPALRSLLAGSRSPRFVYFYTYVCPVYSHTFFPRVIFGCTLPFTFTFARWFPFPFYVLPRAFYVPPRSTFYVPFCSSVGSRSHVAFGWLVVGCCHDFGCVRCHPLVAFTLVVEFIYVVVAHSLLLQFPRCPFHLHILVPGWLDVYTFTLDLILREFTTSHAHYVPFGCCIPGLLVAPDLPFPLPLPLPLPVGSRRSRLHFARICRSTFYYTFPRLRSVTFYVYVLLLVGLILPGCLLVVIYVQFPLHFGFTRYPICYVDFILFTGYLVVTRSTFVITFYILVLLLPVYVVYVYGCSAVYILFGLFVPFATL